MMPGKYDIELKAGGSYEKRFDVTDANGDPVSFLGTDARIQFKEDWGKEVEPILTLEAPPTGGAGALSGIELGNGFFVIYIDDAITGGVLETYRRLVYDLIIVYADGRKLWWMEGNVKIRRRATVAP